LLAAAWFILATPAHAAKSPKPGSSAGEALFTNNLIHTFRITVAEPALSALQRDNRSYVRGELADGTNRYADVGVHLKGMGSFRPLNEKPSFVVKFDRYTPGQHYLGLSKFMLNNASQDPTYLAEYVATQMFRDAGVPAARVTHAFVEFNGRPLGLYVLIEAMNHEFLQRQFVSAKGNLYEAYLADIDSRMDQDGGVDTSQSDVKKLLEVAQGKDPVERAKQLNEIFEVNRYLSHLAIEVFTSHVDGYAMNRNNYRIYHDPATGRFTMIAHGIDWAFANQGVSIDPPRNSILTKAVLQSPGGWGQFKARRAELFTNVFRVDILTNRVNEAVARLRNAARNAQEAAEFENAGVEMRRRIVTRAENVAIQLGRPEPAVLAFDSGGHASLTGWRFKREQGQVAADQVAFDSRATLHLAAQEGGCIGSWRTRVLLEPGLYRFQALVRTVGVQALTNKVELGNGVGIRISGGKRAHDLVGDNGWTPLVHEFEVKAGEEEKDLVCELRAIHGEAWFATADLHLERSK
jgi:hypothetical protein